MEEIVRQQLISIVNQYGSGIVDEPKKVEGLLRDLCGEHKREINTLMLAAREGVARELRAGQNSGVPAEVVAARLRQRLMDGWSMTEEAASWAVESWAAALGIVRPSGPVVPAQPARPVEPAPPAAGSDELNQLLARVRALEENLRQSPPMPLQPPTPVAVPEKPAPPPVLPPAAPPKEQILTLAPGVEMIFVPVPVGSFLMGSDPKVDKAAASEEQPQHRVQLDAFWIGKYPVTNLQYQAFARAAGYRAPEHWNNGTLPAGQEQHPVVFVNWEDATAFSRWAAGLPGGQGVRLPSEAQWEKAARGMDGRIYPWGSEAPDANRCNFNGNIGGTTPVGRYSPRGDSPYGCADMAGNVWEWVADWYAGDYYFFSPASNPTGPTTGIYRIWRGGSWNNETRNVRSSGRNRNLPDNRYFNYGFRCSRQHV